MTPDAKTNFAKLPQNIKVSTLLLIIGSVGAEVGKYYKKNNI